MEMIGAAAHSLSGIIDMSKPGAPVLPPFKYVADVSIELPKRLLRLPRNRDLRVLKKRIWSRLFRI